MIRIGEAQLAMLRGIAEEAGRAILDVYRRDFGASTKQDGSPLTEADLRADSIIRQGLNAAFPGIPILSEESVAGCPDDADCLFVVDPLDGTREFIGKNHEFTVNIALVLDGKAVAGVVHAPALGETFSAGEGLGSWKRFRSQVVPLRVVPYHDGRALRVIGSRSHGTDRLHDWLASLVQEYSFVAAGSSLKFCRVAEGLADIYPRLGPTSQWDTAAAQCVLEQAGGTTAAIDGSDLRYGTDRPVLNPHFAAVGDRRLLSLLPSLCPAGGAV